MKPIDEQALVVGLLKPDGGSGAEGLASKYRDLSVSWIRYKYEGRILEADSVEGILEAASAAGYSYCYILCYGDIIRETWTLDESAGFVETLVEFGEAEPFLASGEILSAKGGYYGLSESCLLVNLSSYRRLGSPRFSGPDSARVVVPRARTIPAGDGGGVRRLEPAGGTVSEKTALPGWNFVRCSLLQGMPLRRLPAKVLDSTIRLNSGSSARRREIARYFGDSIRDFPTGGGDAQVLDGPVAGLLADVAHQARNAERGVFAWNIEGYGDIQPPPSGFQGPISTLYTVTAGFKPNMILHRHGMDDSTRVVFFDYSAAALAFKKLQIERWDGVNFLAFFRDALTELQPLKPYYQLWNGASGNGLDWREVDEKWREELAAWGGGPAFREHWQAFRRLEHDFVLCDIWTQPEALLAKLQNCPRGVIWWSNAFFTMARNWLYSLEARRQIYEEWIRALQETAPQVFVYGADQNGISVNGLSAGDYARAYFAQPGSDLEPIRLQRQSIRF